MLKKYILLWFSMFCFSIMTGCGENEELNAFHESINQFYTEVSNIENSMNEIDSQEEHALETLLNCMEQMLFQFQTLAQIEVPVEFASVEALADDGADYMAEAVRLYTEAYGEEEINDSYIQAAVENYESAMKRVNYIALLLQGEIPEEAVTVEDDGQEFEPYTKTE